MRKKFSLEGKIPASKFPTGSVFPPHQLYIGARDWGPFSTGNRWRLSLSFYFLHQMDNLSLSYTNVQFGIMEDPEIPVQQGGEHLPKPRGVVLSSTYSRRDQVRCFYFQVRQILRTEFRVFTSRINAQVSKRRLLSTLHILLVT